MGKKKNLMWLGFLALAAYGIYEFNEAKEQAAKEVAIENEAERQAIEAYRKKNPDFGPGGINMRMSREIAEKGVLSGYVCKDTNIDTLTSYETSPEKRRNRPAPMIGDRAGFVSVDFEDTLIGPKSKSKGVKISMPKSIPNRYKDSSGR